MSLMKIELIIAPGCPFCREAEQIWRAAATERNVALSLVDVNQADGQAITQRLTLKTVPGVLIDGILKGVGVQTLEEARRLLNQG